MTMYYKVSNWLKIKKMENLVETQIFNLILDFFMLI